jgi:hypothetical protein
MQKSSVYVRHQLVAVLLLLVVSMPLMPGRSVPVVEAAPEQVPLAQSGVLEFLTNNPRLTSWLADMTAWTVGGGFLYWASCPAAPPRAAALDETSSVETPLVDQEQAVAPSATGYLRRWPLRGGSVVTLSSTAVCTGDSMAADATGLYYHDANARAIMFRSVSDPMRAQKVADSAAPNGPIVLDNGDTFWGDYLFWLADGTVYNARKSDFAPAGRPEPLGAGASNLILRGSELLWIENGTIRSMLKYCLAIGGGNCIKNPLYTDTGGSLSSLIDAKKTGPLLGSWVTPFWWKYVSGVSTLRGEGCRNELGYPTVTCSLTTSYTAPSTSNGRYEPGKLVTDGSFLFWVENFVVCSVFCSPNQEGRLMKWNLNHLLIGSTPFATPQPIACRNCGGSYSIANNYEIAVADGWVYFMTSAGLARIRADAPPISWDLRALNMEVTQAIQSPSNDVPLIANKPTYVRLYGDKTSGPSLNGVEARLYGTTTTGAALPGSPLTPINGTRSFTDNNTGMQRANPQSGWVFLLPDSWVQAGSIQLSAQIDPQRVWNDPNRANNSISARTFNFVRKAPICMVFIPVRTVHGPAMFTPAHWFAIDMVRRTVATPDVWTYRQNDDVAELEIKWGGPFNAIPYPGYGPYEMAEDGSKVIISLWLRDQLSDDPDECDKARARTHYVGVVHPNESGANGMGRLGGDQLWFRLPPDDTSQDWRTDRAVTLAHELGHNYGRRHVNCPVGDPDDIGGYPYPTCSIDFDDGENRHYGFLRNTVTGQFETVLPTAAGDLMSYSHRLKSPLPRWPSDFTWNGMRNEIPNGVAIAEAGPDLAATPMVVLSGLIDTVKPNQSSLDHAWVFPVGAASQGMLRKWQRTFAPTADASLAASPAAGAYHLRLFGRDGKQLDDRAITLDETTDGETTRPFLITFPTPSAPVGRIELLDGATVLASLKPGSAAPKVDLLSPKGGTFDSQLTVSWQASDADQSDLLLYTIQYSPDNGATWRTLQTNLPNTTGTTGMVIDLKSFGVLPGNTSNARVRVLASDGYNTTIATSQPFTVVNRAPQPIIVSPWQNQHFAAGEVIVVQGEANDPEDGPLGTNALTWKLNGATVATGKNAVLRGLAPGTYTLSLTARDSAGREATTSISLTVAALTVPQGSAPSLDGECSDSAYASARQVQLAPYADNGQASVHLLRTADDLWVCFSNMARASGGSSISQARLQLDLNYSREAQLQNGDIGLAIGEDGVFTVTNGTAPSTLAGVLGLVSATDTMWQAELKIPAAALGGWNKVVGLRLEQSAVRAASDSFAWPYSSARTNPSTWATTAFATLPQLTAISPGAVPQGAPTTTITVTGANFATGARVRWNGSLRAATVVSSTQLRFTVTSVELMVPGTVAVSVVNPGLEAASSNALPFVIAPVTPQSSTRILLPITQR